MLRVQGVSSGYGPVLVLEGISLHVEEGETVAVLGANGAGKSTLLNTLVGVVRPRSGEVWLSGQRIDRRPTEEIVRAGLTLVPEGRRVFAGLTVGENLGIGAYARSDRRQVARDLDALLDRFPVLAERRSQPAGTLSGGEQQQLAIARALMSRPRIVLLDEPSLGLAPVMVDTVFDLVAELGRRDGLTVVVVEQNISHALDLATRVYVMSEGRITTEGTNTEVAAAAHELEASYLGGWG